MERLLNYLKNQRNNWLIGGDSQQFYEIAAELYLELIQQQQATPPKIILAEREPVRFLASLLAACAANCPVFLCNYDWAKQEWQQVFDLVQPDIIWGLDCNFAYHLGDSQLDKPTSFTAITCLSCPYIMIPTGGSSGKIKFAIHTWETLMVSVRGFKEYFELDQVNSFCVLPLYHVSGLMQFMRSFTSGGKLAVVPFSEIEFTQAWNIDLSNFFTSLVPTQLQRLLENSSSIQWLSQFQTVLLGGAPAWSTLLEKAREYKIKVAPTYGMTETASQIATLKSDDFINGVISAGQILPHAKVKIINEQGETLKSNQIGSIVIETQSLALGYYPLDISSFPTPTPLTIQPDDLGFLDSKGYLNIIGRGSDKIITGGENVYPAEIEAAIKETGMVIDVCVIGVPDRYWGQAVTAIYIPKNSHVCDLDMKNLLKDKLSKFKIPKTWIPVDSLPRNSQGKINRQYLYSIVGVSFINSAVE
jgi:O-succinylbenzoic acid--CoA ligase